MTERLNGPIRQGPRMFTQEGDRPVTYGTAGMGDEGCPNDPTAETFDAIAAEARLVGRRVLGRVGALSSTDSGRMAAAGLDAQPRGRGVPSPRQGG